MYACDVCHVCMHVHVCVRVCMCVWLVVMPAWLQHDTLRLFMSELVCLPAKRKTRPVKTSITVQFFFICPLCACVLQMAMMTP